MTLDLTGARTTVESLMTDQCTIKFDAGGTHDDVLDPVTLGLTRPANDSTAVYTGKCSVYPESALTTVTTVEGGAERALLRYIVAIPAAATIPPVGSLVHLTATADPGMTNAVLRVAAVIGRTRVVVRKLRCELRQPVTDRP